VDQASAQIRRRWTGYVQHGCGRSGSRWRVVGGERGESLGLALSLKQGLVEAGGVGENAMRKYTMRCESVRNKSMQCVGDGPVWQVVGAVGISR
jgi:hypothetical protein